MPRRPFNFPSEITDFEKLINLTCARTAQAFELIFQLIFNQNLIKSVAQFRQLVATPPCDVGAFFHPISYITKR